MRFLACAVLFHLYAKYWFDTFGINFLSLYSLEWFHRHCSKQDTIVKDSWCITVSLKDTVLGTEYVLYTISYFCYQLFSYQWRADDVRIVHR